MSIQVRSNEKPSPPPEKALAENSSADGAPQADQASDGGSSQEQTPSSSPSSALGGQEPSEQKEKPSESDPAGEIEPKQEEEKEEEGKEPKKKGGFQRRIDKLNARLTDREREIEYWKQQALTSASGSKTEPDHPRGTPAFANPNATAPAKPMPEHFETHAEYVEALTDWKTDQKLNERDQRTAKERFDQEQSKIVNSYTERMKAFSEKNRDFQEVIAEVDHIPLSPVLRDILLTSENGPEIAYELAKIPGEYERISRLPPIAAAREIGKFESRLSSSQKGSVEKNEKKITQAPKPIEPVGTGKGSAAKSIFDPHLTQAEYEALRREQLKQRRRAS